MFGYFVWLGISSDPRFDDGVIDASEMHAAEVILMAIGIFAAFGAWLNALFNALSSERQKWAFAIFFFWPCAFVYLWKFASNSQPVEAR